MQDGGIERLPVAVKSPNGRMGWLSNYSRYVIPTPVGRSHRGLRKFFDPIWFFWFLQPLVVSHLLSQLLLKINMAFLGQKRNWYSHAHSSSIVLWVRMNGSQNNYSMCWSQDMESNCDSVKHGQFLIVCWMCLHVNNMLCIQCCTWLVTSKPSYFCLPSLF